MDSILKSLKRIVTLLAVVLLCVSCSKIPSVSYNPWNVVPLPTEANLNDISFTDDLQHGWLVGSEATLLETADGGKTWELKQLGLDDERARLNSVSFAGSEGWIVGEPSILLHTTDTGQSWEQIALSDKLPGSPLTIVALGDDSAEMTTNVGAIYRTQDGGRSWKAMVEEAVGVIRNLDRSPDGKYIAVSAKGNFFSIWEPGQSAWVPHNRNSSRRIQNMGFAADGRLWMLARGGQLQFSTPEDPENWDEAIYPEFSTSWGLLDLAYRTPEELWIGGGSGNLLRSTDGGVTWEKDRDVENVPSNFYKVLFLNEETGYAIGQQGILLKYEGTSESA
ncbi:MAG: photosynthesis system II assembly factor Ycf48 [Chroococcales cyanobacterium]